MRAEEVDPKGTAVRRRTLVDGHERNAHGRVPGFRRTVDAGGNLKSRIPLPAVLVLWLGQVDVQIDPFPLRRDLELFVAADVLKVRANKNLRDVPVPELEGFC